MTRTPAPRGPKAQKVDRQALLDAALKVFARDGLEAASIRAIAREAGCDPSLLYYHFDNKEAMLASLLDARIPPMARELWHLANPLDGRSTAEKLWECQRCFHRHMAGSPGFRAMVRGQIVQGASALPERLASALRPAQLAGHAIVRRGQRRGDLRRDLHPFLVIFFLMRMEGEILDLVPTFAWQAAGLPAETALPLAERAWFETFWRGVAADPSQPLTFLS